MTSPDTVSTCAELDKNRLDQTREDKRLKDLARKDAINEAFDYFWSSMFLSKKAKPVAMKSFDKAMKTIADPMHFAKYLQKDTETRHNNHQIGFDKMNPSTYLNQSRWEDEYTIDTQSQKVSSTDGGDWAEKYKDTF